MSTSHDRAWEGGYYLTILRGERRWTARALALKAGLEPSDLSKWTKGEPIPRTKRIMGGLSRALEIPEDILWGYLQGNIPLEDLPPTTISQMRDTIPDSWVVALHPIVPLVNQVFFASLLGKMRDKILAKVEASEEEES